MKVNIARSARYAFLIIAALFFLLPFYIMVVTSLKSSAEIASSSLFSFPLQPTIEYWVKAWAGACTGLTCEGIQTGFVNSLLITAPSVVISLFLAALNGYALTFWRPKFGNVLFITLLIVVFIPYQIFIYPLVKAFSYLNLYGTAINIIAVHVIFSLPLMTIIFRNYYLGLPEEIFKAAKIDGAGFWQIFFRIVLPMSTPMLAVGVILQATGVWNDFLFGAIFAGDDYAPMTVALNNIVNSQFGEKEYNVNMAATLLTAIVPLVIYFVSGKYFVRGISSGAIKG